MLDTTFAVNGKTLNYHGRTFTLVRAGIENDEPFAEVEPKNTAVKRAIIRHIRSFMPLPFSLEEVQKELT
jgi:hypothetical protein